MTASATEIIALEKAINSGVTEVSYGDKRVTYRSLADMRQLLADMKRDFAGLNRVRQFRVLTRADKGL
jgi:hypothetical protein